MFQEKVKKLTELMVRKLEIVQAPKDGDLCVAVKTVDKDQGREITIAVGLAIRYPAIFKISGYVLEEKEDHFFRSDAAFGIIKLPYNIRITCGVAKEGFPRTKSEKKIDLKSQLMDPSMYVFFGNTELRTLDDLLKILEKMPDTTRDQ